MPPNTRVRPLEHEHTPPNVYTHPTTQMHTPTRTHAPQHICMPPNTYARPPTSCTCRPAQGPAWVWAWASSEGEGMGIQHGCAWKGMGMHVGTQCEFEGKGVDRENEGMDHEDEGVDCEDEGVDCEDEGVDCEGEGEEHGQKCQGMGVSIETWCLGKCKGMWWAKAKVRKRRNVRGSSVNIK
ncbi:hypothetical protein DFH94DRAFT_685985 [Russula ochroleuca]|uniref:Uncharacterized protein n=1 Tax=Russula ochroleuca TaxID=152965 RepID=A0A9P5JVU9_9AGAM|nr:hypothetical protein DFH94DRAFT_685985 [Russula ochroleuca]